MPLKTNPADWTIKEQIIVDDASGLTIQFEVLPDGTRSLRVFGDLPYGNREIVFDHSGKEAGAGTAVTGLCRPTWMTRVESL